MLPFSVTGGVIREVSVEVLATIPAIAALTAAALYVATYLSFVRLL